MRRNRPPAENLSAQSPNRIASRTASWSATQGRTAMLLAVTMILAGTSVYAIRAEAAPPPDELPADRGCGSPNAFLATTCFVRGQTFDNEPAIVTFTDSPDADEVEPFELAKIRDVGSTYGLAYDPERDVLYAGAYHKRNAKHGPAGPGGIYVVPLDGSKITRLIKVPDAGRDMHDRDNNYQPDDRGRGYAGKTSLGDIDLDASYETLYVMNLEDRKIHTIEVPSGTWIGSFDHGAVAEDWADDARPFGLKVHQDWVYHGLVRSALKSREPDDLAAYVYRSRGDGSEMQLVARFSLDYDRGKHPRWNPWPRNDDKGRETKEHPSPMLSDIEFDAEGNMVVGLRDRWIDTGPDLTEYYRVASGDVLKLEPTDDGVDGGAGWVIDVSLPEHYPQDNLDPTHDEIVLGGLTQLLGVDIVASTAIDPFRAHPGGTNIGAVSAGALWFDNPSGDTIGREEIIYNARSHSGPLGKAIGLGDFEHLCSPPRTPTATPEHTPTVTQTPTNTVVPSVTPTPTATAAPSSTPTATPEPRVYTIYLPYGENLCVPEKRFVDVVLVLDRSTSMLRSVEEGGIAKNEAAIAAAARFVEVLALEPDPTDALGRHDQVSIVGFNDTAWTEVALTNNRTAANDALDRLRTKTIEGTRLDLAITQGQVPLDGPERIPENEAVIVLLTDGLPNRVPFDASKGERQEDTVLRAADVVRAKGSTVYTIGLGRAADINPRLLISMATERFNYYYAPVPEELEGIYEIIADDFTFCGREKVPPPEPCIPEHVESDVILVIDMSTSMERETREGRMKAEAAVDAAGRFVELLRLEWDGWGRQDRVAVVGFNGESWTEVRLTSDRAEAEAAVGRLLDKRAEGTRLDLAFEEGLGAWVGSVPRPESRAIMILLTDGLPNMVPTPVPSGSQEETVLRAAERVKATGMRVFTIGLGLPDDVLRELLESAASSPRDHYFASDGEDLADIYRQIAGRVRECP